MNETNQKLRVYKANALWNTVCPRCEWHTTATLHNAAINHALRHIKVCTGMPDRYRCTVIGCNPTLLGAASAGAHVRATGHRTAKWPVRSAEGEAKARKRNKTGYYRKYNGVKPRRF